MRDSYRFAIAFFCLASLSLATAARADLSLTDISAGLTPVYRSGVAWGDYDGDGFMDIALTGNPTVTGIPVSRIYHGDGTNFTDIHATLLPATHSAAGWGDYDRDGDLDLFAMGWSGSSDVASLYRNDGAAGFHRVGGPFAPAEDGYVVWGDFDNDGDLDLLASGPRVNDGDGLYRNDGALGFIPLHVSFLTAYNSAAWGDYDGDGDLDLLVGAQVCRNDGNGQFVVTNPNTLRPVQNAVAWGDFDNDGDLDFLLSGWDGETQSARTWIYRNDGGDKFTDIGANLQGACHGTVAWADIDNDGYMDVLITGGIGPSEYYTTITRLYRNNHAGGFVPMNVALKPGGYSAAWGDYDDDGDLDLLLTGYDDPGRLSAVYRNDGVPPNQPPSAPAGLSAQIVGDHLVMSWMRAIDDRTPALGLSYNVRVGTESGRDNVVPCMANTTTGQRRVAALGNASERTTMSVKLPPMWDALYWSVQAIDASYAGSPFAGEQVVGGVPTLPSAVSAHAGPNGVELEWYSVAGTKVTVYRRTADSDWAALGAASSDGAGLLRFTDSTAQAGERYGYRLGIASSGGDVFSQETWIDVPHAQLAFRLEPPAPNPSSSGASTVSLALPQDARASLELFDPRGRVVSTWSFSSSGRFTVNLGQPMRLPRGSYYLRLSQSGRHVSRRLTID